MKRTIFLVLCICAVSTARAQGGPPAAGSAWKSVEKILGRPGTEEGGDLRVLFPRMDLNVVVNGIPLEPELALTSWFDFKPLLKGTSLTGEMVLLDSEVPSVTARLLKEGFQLTGLTHSLLDESPAMKILRLKGEGPRSRLAESLKSLLSLTGISLKSSPLPPDPAVPAPDWTVVERILGPGHREGKVLAYLFSPRTAGPGGESPDSPEMETSIGFQRVQGAVIPRKGPLNLGLKPSKEEVAAAGRLVLAKGELDGLLKAMEGSNITVTAMEEISPQAPIPLVSIHFWTEGDAEETASALKSVLEGMGLGPAGQGLQQDSGGQAEGR